MTMRLLAALTALGLSAAATPPLPPTPARDPSDPFYTSYHFQPLKNWMNDPNGPFYDEATKLYHLFAQYNPHGARWGDMNWYHAVSKDMVHWAHLPVALEPDHDFDCGGEFSGSATVMPDAAGTPVLSVSVACGKWVFFAIPEDKAADPLMIKWRKNGTMPVSGKEFSGPLFDAPAYSTGGFRDPTTAWQGTDKVWRMATGCGDKKKGGACLFKSENFVNWTAVGWLHHPQGQQNVAFWECPDFFQIPGSDKWVLKGSASGDWWSLGTYAQVAGMKEDTFTPVSYDVHDGSTAGLGLQKYDFGQFYASKTFYDPAKKRQILWGWVAEEGPAPHPGEDWSSIQSLPRSILIDPSNETRLMFPPIEELEALRGSPIVIPSVNITADWTKAGVNAGVSVMGGVVITLKSLPKTDPKNPEGVDLLMLDCGGKTGQSVIGPSSSTVSLRVFLDKSSIEAYAAGGRGVASHRVYPTAAELKQGGIALVNSGEGAVTMSGAAWPMAEATRPSVEELLLR